MNKAQSQTPEQHEFYLCGIFTGKFSTGIKYVAPCDREFYKGLSKEEYHHGFTERDKLLDAAINHGRDLDLSGNLWRVYDEAVMSYGLKPIQPYEWLFKHAELTDKSIVIDIPSNRILLLSGDSDIAYHDYIHGLGAYWLKHLKRID